MFLLTLVPVFVLVVLLCQWFQLMPQFSLLSLLLFSVSTLKLSSLNNFNRRNFDFFLAIVRVSQYYPLRFVGKLMTKRNYIF